MFVSARQLVAHRLELHEPFVGSKRIRLQPGFIRGAQLPRKAGRAVDCQSQKPFLQSGKDSQGEIFGS